MNLKFEFEYLNKTSLIKVRFIKQHEMHIKKVT